MNESFSFINHNGVVVNSNDPIIAYNNRSFAYGDGCFETMRMVNGKLLLADLHFERLFNFLRLLKFKLPEHFSASYFYEQIAELVNKNRHSENARIRLNVYRGNGNLFDSNWTAGFVIQSSPNTASFEINEKGLTASIFTDGKKSTDCFSSIKSSNYLIYTMAVIEAAEQGVDDSLILNVHGNIIEATTSNIFVVHKGVIKTPFLTEGCISGVMRRYLLEWFKKGGGSFQECILTHELLAESTEVFITNAVHGIRWISRIGKCNFENNISKKLHDEFVKPLFSQTNH